MIATLRIAALACAAAACVGAEGAQPAGHRHDVAAAAADAQTGLASRVAAAPDGEVWFHYATRAGVCGAGDDITTGHVPGEHETVVNEGEWRDGERNLCLEGPTWVALEKHGGRIDEARVRVARAWPTQGRRVTDAGRVGVREATDYLLSLAERSDEGKVGEKAIFASTLADSVTTWPALLRLARNDAVSEQTRRGAVFWVSQQAGDRITRELAGFVDDDREGRELRKHAVFALSQRPRDEAVPELIRIARTHRDPEIRKSALFWLGQSHDPRALALFEEILSH
jgi:hypothetical protein